MKMYEIQCKHEAQVAAEAAERRLALARGHSAAHLRPLPLPAQHLQQQGPSTQQFVRAVDAPTTALTALRTRAAQNTAVQVA